MKRFGGTCVLTLDDVALMMALVGDLEPKNYKHDAAKALIHKCKAQLAEPSDRIRILPN